MNHIQSLKIDKTLVQHSHLNNAKQPPHAPPHHSVPTQISFIDVIINSTLTNNLISIEATKVLINVVHFLISKNIFGFNFYFIFLWNLQVSFQMIFGFNHFSQRI
jgi:hypothetical protein